MNDKTLVERLREHRVILKSGDYDGAQLMRAWCDIINAADTIEAQATRIEALEVALRYCTDTPHSGWTIAQTVAKQALESQP